MKPYFDGYCFCRRAENTLYNSSMCLYYLDEICIAKDLLPPENHLDPAMNSEDTKLQQLFSKPRMIWPIILSTLTFPDDLSYLTTWRRISI